MAYYLTLGLSTVEQLVTRWWRRLPGNRDVKSWVYFVDGRADTNQMAAAASAILANHWPGIRTPRHPVRAVRVVGSNARHNRLADAIDCWLGTLHAHFASRNSWQSLRQALHGDLPASSDDRLGALMCNIRPYVVVLIGDAAEFNSVLPFPLTSERCWRVARVTARNGRVTRFQPDPSSWWRR